METAANAEVVFSKIMILKNADRQVHKSKVREIICNTRRVLDVFVKNISIKLKFF